VIERKIFKNNTTYHGPVVVHKVNSFLMLEAKGGKWDGESSQSLGVCFSLM
jgi:hypothetical protein